MLAVLISGVFVVDNGLGGNSPGSFIWALEQANLNPGYDTVVFNIPTTDPSYICIGGNCWFSISLNTTPPPITEGVIIDGATQTTYTGNTNLCDINYRAYTDSTGWTSIRDGYPRIAGVNGARVPYFPCPEIEIDLNGKSSSTGIFSIQASNVVIKNLAIYNGGGGSGSQVIRIRPGSQNILIENLILGLRANGVPDSTPSDGIFADSATSGILRKVYVGFFGTHGVKFGNASGGPTNGWVLDSSEIFGSGWNWDQADNINVYARNITLKHNLIHSSDGSSLASDIRVFASGVEVRYDGDSARIYENTIYSNATKGVFVDGSSKYVEIVGNVIFGNGWRLAGPGVGVGERGGNSKYILISRNSFSNNGGLAIDLDSTGLSGFAGDGVTCNDDLRQAGNPNELIDYPYIDSARVIISPSDTSLYVWGRAYTGADSVEIYLVSTPDMFNCSGEVNGHGEGGLFLGALRVVLNEFSGVISLNGLGVDWFSPQMITALSRDNLMNTSEFSQNYPLPSPLNFGDELSISESFMKIGDVSVYSIDGRLIFKGKVDEFRGKAGIYFIKTQKGTFKIILQP